MRQACPRSAVQFTNYWMRAFIRAGIEPGEARASLDCFLSSVLGRRAALEVYSNTTREREAYPTSTCASTKLLLPKKSAKVACSIYLGRVAV